MKCLRIAFVIVCVVAISADVRADTFTIADGDVAALVASIQQANQNNEADTIYLALKGRYLFTTAAASTFDGFSALPTVVLDQTLSNRIIVFGNGSELMRDMAAAPFRIWMIFGGSLELHDVVIRNGYLNGLPGTTGGGIANYGGELAVFNSTFADNIGNFQGGALYVSVGSPTELTNCTLTGNKAAYGSAIYFFSGSAFMTHCTIAGNVCTSANGAALYNALIVDDPNRRVFLKNSIVALNVTNDGTPSDLSGVIITMLRNVVGANNDPNAQVWMPLGSPSMYLDYVGTATSPIDPLLNALNDNGGLTPTMSIATDSSPAFNNGGLPANTIATDQAGNYRLGNAEIGSLEFSNNPILNPAIEVQAVAGIPSGSTFNMGDVVNGQASGPTTFKILNTGFFQKLNLLGNPKIIVTGAHASEFVVDQSATAREIAGNSETFFYVNFIPTSTGLKSAVISIASNDTSKPVYTITLTAKSISGVPSLIDVDLDVIADSPVCEGTPVSVNIKDSEAGVDYQVFKGSSPVSEVVSGGGDLVISVDQSGMSPGDNLLKVLGTRPGVGSDTLDLTPVVHVDEVTEIVVQPSDAAGSSGATASLTIGASGTGLNYQWMRGSTTLSDDSRFSGVTSSTLTISNLVVADVGSYHCIVTGTCGSATSNTVLLTVGKAVPVLTFTSLPTEGLTGEELTLTATSSSPAEIDFAITGGTGVGTFVSVGILKLDGAGSIEVTAAQESTEEYEAVATSQVIIVHDAVTSVEDYEGDLVVFPNPTNSELTIRSGRAEKVWLIDGFGVSVIEWTMVQGDLTVDLARVSPGLYLLMGVKGTTVVFFRKVLKR